MTVFFVYRSGYMGPAGKRLWRFEEKSVLGWFASRWKTWRVIDEGRIEQQVQREFGLSIPFLVRLFSSAARQKRKAPNTSIDLMHLTMDADPEEEIAETPNCLQVREYDKQSNLICYYIFDDHFLRQQAHRDLAAFLLHEDWQLPASPETAPGLGKRTEHVFIDDTRHDDAQAFPCELEGVARHLISSTLEPPFEVEIPLLRALLLVERKKATPMERGFLADIRADPTNETTWHVFSDWLQEQGEPPVGLYLLQQALTRIAADSMVLSVWNDYEIEEASWDKPVLKSYRSAKEIASTQDGRKNHNGHVHVEQHLAQLSFPSWRDRHIGERYLQSILFDDVWASAHNVLAEAIRRYATQWDVLTMD